MVRPSLVTPIGCLLLVVAGCAGQLVDRDIDDDGDGGADADAEPDAVGERDGGSGAGDPAPTGDGDPAGEDPAPEPDSGARPVNPADGDCVEACGLCTVDVDACCGYTICQDDWSGETHCMPVVPPHSRLCPTGAPEPGSECPEPGLLCRYDDAVRCKCGCDGWNCPYGG